jgi:chemotaxis protein MotB
MANKTTFIILLFSCALVQSCVSNKQMKASRDEVDRLTSENVSLRNQVDEYKQQVTTLNSQVGTLTANNKSMNAQFVDYREDCEATQRKLDAYRESMHEEFQTLRAMGQIIMEAVAEFEGQGVEVVEHNGRIYVNLQDNILYKSGSAAISPNGSKALGGLAAALNKYPNLQVIVVGHTDDVAFKGGANDNMNLSTQRANSVVKILRDQYDVSPVRLVAAGQGKYAPIADNSTQEGKAKNRRTEIILNPDYEKMWNMVESSK